MSLFRSATACLPSVRSSAARTASVNAWRRPVAVRLYSDAKGKEKEDSSSDDKPVSEADAPLQECTTKLAAKEAEVVDLTGRLRYAQADYQNLQRISQREKEQTRDFAISRFASDLLETVDVLTLALRSVPSSSLSPAESPLPSSSSSAANEKSTLAHLTELHQGVSLTHKQLLSTLAKYGVRQFDPTGDKFDPNLHEALYAAPIPGKEPGSVVECQKFGYMIKDRVLRAAQVGVVQELPESTTASS